MKSDNRTDAEKSAAAKALHARQRHYDRLHHRRRLIWLEQTPCMYSDGTKIPEYFRLTLINGSKECLRVINDHAMSTNSVDLNSTDYLAVLDKFEKTGEYDGQHTQGERVSRCEIYRQAWMSDGQFECYQMLSDLFFGPHHITGTVKEYGSGIAVNVRNFRGATYDYDGLTRAVIMAHDRAIRFEIEPSGPGMLKLVLHKRQREGRMYERHPTLEEAITLLRDAQEEAKP